MRTSATGVVVAIFLLGITAARAAETYPSEVRTITTTSATSSCIGAPKTPVCAVETLLGCFARREAKLCRSITMQPFDPAEAPPTEVSYRILWVLISQEKRDAAKALHAVVAVERFRDEWADIYIHFLNSNGSRWTIDDWGMEGEIGLPLRIDSRRTEILEKRGSVPLVVTP